MSSEGRFRVAIAGGSGYGGAEMLRWLAVHPHFEACAVSSRANAEEPVPSVHPNLAGFYDDLAFVEQPLDLLASDPEIVVLALPHGHAAKHARALGEARAELRIIDLSGDHRLDDPETYALHYGVEHPHPEELTDGKWVYGLPETGDLGAGVRRIANPGCFATGAVLGLLPLAVDDHVSGRVHHVAITGSSGSGALAKAGTHHPERTEDVRAYKVGRHQHVPEITACLQREGLSENAAWSMVPQSGPFARGIYTTLQVKLDRPMDQDELEELYETVYLDDPFIRLRSGATPRLREVRNTNFCDISVHAQDGDLHAIVITAIDNLCKGMVTQAIQNLNIACDLPETAGLLVPGGRP